MSCEDVRLVFNRHAYRRKDRWHLLREYRQNRFCIALRLVTKGPMNNIIRAIVSGFIAFTVTARVSMGGNFDFEIHCVPKKLDESVKKGSAGGANINREHWAYDLTIENKTFKELADLEVKYVIFFRQEQLGKKADAMSRRENGSFSIPGLKSHEKKSFTTDAVELKKSNLVGNWHYTSGAKPNAQDTLVGLAVRVYQNGQQVAEYANPSTLTREKWE